MEEVIILVHDAWHTPDHYLSYVEALRRAAFRVYCPLLPTCNQTLPLYRRTFLDDVAAIHKLVEDHANDGEKIILIMHGYGGAVGSNALEQPSFKYRAAHNRWGGVVHLVYMCAYMLPVGRSVMDIYMEAALSGHHTMLEAFPNQTTSHLNPERLYCRGFNANETQQYLRSLVPFPGPALEFSTTQAAWMHIPFTYLSATNDCALFPISQQSMIMRASNSSYEFKEKRYDAGHSIFQTHTWRMVEEILILCGVFWMQPQEERTRRQRA